jgi:hypothetical protein
MDKKPGRDGGIILKTNMPMQQKTIWTHSLLLGISASFLGSGCNNSEIVEYGVTMDLLYINETDNSVSLNIREANSSTNTEVILGADSKSEVYSYELDGADKSVSPDTCCQEFLIDVFGARSLEGNSQSFQVNDTVCFVHLDEKSVLISNYSSEIIANRHFRYTYTFTENDFLNAMPCE